MKKIIWISLSCLMALSLVLASCAAEVEEEEEEGPPMEEEEEEEEEEGPPVGGDWWDKFGEPEYGGTITFRITSDAGSFDPWYPWGAHSFPYEQLLQYDWALDREIWPFKTSWAPPEYFVGNLLESWEFPDGATMIAKVRENVYWHDKAPSYGRKFTAYDIQAHYDRSWGVRDFADDGPNPYYLGWVPMIELVTALDEDTIQIDYKGDVILPNMWSTIESAIPNQIENPDAVEQGVLADWEYACGTGPYMLVDYIKGSALNFDRNPNYWGYDPRHPENQLPYADHISLQVIPDIATAMAALRTGKIDILDGVSWEQVASLKKTNPELLSSALPLNGLALELRVDKQPFSDINVRKAMQMAIDRELISETHFGGTVSSKAQGLACSAYKGWSMPYDEWPADLKEEYTYNPEKAKQLLADAGYPDGFKVGCMASSTQDLELLQIAQGLLKDINVDMEIEVVEQAAYVSTTMQKLHDHMSWQHMIAQAQPPPISINQYLTTNPTNFTFHTDPVYDQRHAEFFKSTSSEDAIKNFQAADMYFISQHWLIQMTERSQFNVYQPYIGGYSGESVTGFPRVLMWKGIWVDQEMKKSMGR